MLIAIENCGSYLVSTEEIPAGESPVHFSATTHLVHVGVLVLWHKNKSYIISVKDMLMNPGLHAHIRVRTREEMVQQGIAIHERDLVPRLL